MSVARIESRTVIVTGAGSGVGHELVRMFHANGDLVVAADLDAGRLLELNDELFGLMTVCADISTARGAAEIVGAAGSRVDVLCNNAGIGDLNWVDELTEERWDRVIDVNLKGTFLLTQLVVPLMLAVGGGSIVNTASISAFQGGRAGAAYTAAKAGVVGLTKHVAATLGSQGIRCNAVCPGSIATSISKSMTPPSERLAHYRARDREKPPPASAMEVAEAIFFLASPAASRINGASLVVDGGWTAY